MEMDSQLQRQRAELSLTDMQLQQKMTNLKINELIIDELKQNSESRLFKSCGKLFLKTDSKSYLSDLNDLDTNSQEQINGLKKKKQYLETSLDVTFENMKKYIGN